MTNEALRIVYMAGWADSGDGKDVRHDYAGLARIAYEWGWRDFLAGDDNPSIDYREWDQIAADIRRAHRGQS